MTRRFLCASTCALIAAPTACGRLSAASPLPAALDLVRRHLRLSRPHPQGNQATVSCASTISAFFRRAPTIYPQSQRPWTCTGGNDGPVLDQTPWKLGQCEGPRSEVAGTRISVPFEEAAAPLGVAPAAQRQTYREFGMQWPQPSVPAVY